MNQTLQAMRQLEERFVAWAGDREDVRMAIVVGSWARDDHPADEWSDLDIGFSTTDPERYLSSDAWLSEIGDVWLWYPDPTGVTRHVLFAGGLDAGLAPLSHSAVTQAVRFVPLLRRFPLCHLVPGGLRRGVEGQLSEAAAYLSRGARLILDKDGLYQKFLALLPPNGPSRPGPDEQQYLLAVRTFLFEAVWCAKHLRRGELWYAKNAALDGRMKAQLLQMLEWRALAQHGPEFDTWESGRFLEEWADPETLRTLHDTFARYDLEECWHALIATTDLFRRVAADVAKKSGFIYPADADARVVQWLRATMSDRESASTSS